MIVKGSIKTTCIYFRFFGFILVKILFRLALLANTRMAAQLIQRVRFLQCFLKKMSYLNGMHFRLVSIIVQSLSIHLIEKPFSLYIIWQVN